MTEEWLAEACCCYGNVVQCLTHWKVEDFDALLQIYNEPQLDVPLPSASYHVITLRLNIDINCKLLAY